MSNADQAMVLAKNRMSDAATKQSAMIVRMGMTTDMFERILHNALIANPQLAQCTENSLYKAVYDCAQFGFVPDGKAGALVPIRNNNVLEANFWPMVDGLVAKAREALPKASINTEVVYRYDEFEDMRGTGPRIHHKPKRETMPKPDDVIAVYATIHQAGNPIPEYEIMYKAEIDHARSLSRSNRGPWSTNYIGMARARVLSRLCKRFVTTKLVGVLQLGEDDIDDFTGPTIDGTATQVEEPAQVAGNPAATAAKPAAQAQEPDPAPQQAPQAQEAAQERPQEQETRQEQVDEETGQAVEVYDGDGEDPGDDGSGGYKPKPGSPF